MKKRLWMILMIILLIMFMPRYNSYRSKVNHGQRSPHRKVPVGTDDFEFPFPAKWLLMSIFWENNLRNQFVVSSTLLASGSRYNRYEPAQTGYNPMF
ncbi:MAG: hypothetical protein ABIN89_13845 [Chitinophagaceae bacterium]